MIRPWLALSTASFSIVLGSGACVGDNPQPGGALGSSGGPSNEDGGPSYPPVSSGGTGSSSSGAPDSGTACAEPTTCVNGKLVACGATVVDCGTVGCLQASATNATRCKLFTPTAPAKTSDLTNEIITASLEIGADTTIDVTSGAITRGGVTVRGPTNGATWNEDHGIGFEIRQVKAGRNAAVFVAKDIVLTGTPTFAGSVSASQAFVLVAQNTVKVTGNVTFPCGVVTGGEPPGGDVSGPAGGHVGGAVTVSVPFAAGGGGGGGHVGGAAGGTVQGTQSNPGVPGSSIPLEVPGGAGGLASSGTLAAGGGGGQAFGAGGGGGAAVLLVAGAILSLEGPSGAGIDVSGCGGAAPGGGGGGGGWLGIEAPAIRGASGAGLAANGGGGGGSVAGERGVFAVTPARGGVANDSIAAGGTGGTDATPNAGGSFHNVTVSRLAGGGGGSGGRIILRTATGALDLPAGATEGAGPWFTSPTSTLLGLQAEAD